MEQTPEDRVPEVPSEEERQGKPEIAKPGEGRTILGGREGAGRVSFEADLEAQQTSALARQMMRSTEQQLHIASEHVHSIRWVETEGSRHLEGDDHLAISEFELTLSNGKRIYIVGPIMNMLIEEGVDLT